MKVLWLCNFMLPAIAESLGLKAGNKEGWVAGLADAIQNRKEENALELGVCFPTANPMETLKGELDGICYYSFFEDSKNPHRYQAQYEASLRAIVEEFKPDLVHLFGTEYPHTLAMTKAFPHPDRLLVGMQGVCFEYALVYTKGLPWKIINRSLFRDVIKKDNILKQQRKFTQRGLHEKEALLKIGNVCGRTEFDYKAVKEINKNNTYYFMNETLRSNFYGKEWDYKKCQPNSIFLSQGDYPIKGLHFLLKAMPVILADFPKTQVYVAGDVITRYTTWKEKLKISSYGKYIRDLIIENKLQNHITFLGRLDAVSMCNQFLNSHLFLSPSVIENSPNSVGEAMLLGMPVVSSDVGGVSSMMIHEKEGLLYPCEDTQALADSVIRIFKDEQLADNLAYAARQRALITHDPETNYSRLMEVYHDVFNHICL